MGVRGGAVAVAVQSSLERAVVAEAEPLADCFEGLVAERRKAPREDIVTELGIGGSRGLLSN